MTDTTHISGASTVTRIPFEVLALFAIRLQTMWLDSIDAINKYLQTKWPGSKHFSGRLSFNELCTVTPT